MRTPCLVLQPHMHNSTGSPVFLDFQLDLSGVAVSQPLVEGNEDAGYKGEIWHKYKWLWVNIYLDCKLIGS